MTRKDFLRLTAGAAMAPVAIAAASPQPPPPVDRITNGGTLIRGANLLTMDTQLDELSAGDVLIEDGKIAAIGHGLPAAGAEVWPAEGMILMPGMIDGHRHIWEGIETGDLVKTEPKRFAGYLDSMKKTIVCLTPEDHYLAEYVGALQAIDSGVTTVADYAHAQYTTDRALAAARGLMDSGINGWFVYEVAQSPHYGPGSTIPLAKVNSDHLLPADEAHFQAVAALQQSMFSDGSAPLQLGIAPSPGIYGKPMAAVKAEMDRIRATGVRFISLHNHKPMPPYPAGTLGGRANGVADLHDAGLLGPDFQLAHANDLTAGELRMLRDTGGMTCSTVMGESVYRGSGYRGGSVHARARKAGVPAGIGIDVGIAMPQGYFEHIRDAFWTLYQDDESMAIAADYKSQDVLDFATRLGARAVRLGDVAGTITVGKRADLVLLRTDRFGFPMMGSLADRVVNFATQSDIDSVWVAGKLRKTKGKMIGIDWTALKGRVRTVQERYTAQRATIQFTT
jgi:cytosine/adenosine deaminase-related metal-dependent hydrolase